MTMLVMQEFGRALMKVPEMTMVKDFRWTALKVFGHVVLNLPLVTTSDQFRTNFKLREHHFWAEFQF